MLLWLLAILIAAAVAPTVNRVVGSMDGVTLGGWVLAAVPAGVFIALLTLWPSVVNQQDVSVFVDWVPALNLAVSLRLDGLSLLFGLMVTGIGALILVYAGAYLRGDDRLGRLWMLLLLFMAAMLGLVLADNLLTLFIFWELTSITSYLLIGFNSDRPESRASALQALLVTGGGGLVLLPGLILLGLAGNSFEISALLTSAEQIREHSFYLPMLVLILVGAFTKSAQFPFHFWLPNAMAAPTPISAYLHSATMVKAGVYLIARLHPILGGTAEWFWIIASVGAITMLLGAVLALRATDLKQILAYATISVLGTLTLLLGIGTEATLVAALAVLVAHACYKGGLFMVAGAIDHSVHQRDVRELGGLRMAMPATFAAACLAGCSMAGVLPTFGFIAKETWYESIGHVAGNGFLAASILANLGLVAAVGFVCVKPFFGRRTESTHHAHEGGPAMWGPPVVLGIAGLALGLLPTRISELLAAGSGAIAGRAVPVHLALWHGVNVTLLLSLLTLAGGGALYWILRQGQLHRLKPYFYFFEGVMQYGPSRVYHWLLRTVNQFARGQTAMLQNGYLRFYLFTMVGLTVASVWMALGGELHSHLKPMPLDVRVHEVLLACLILAAAVVAVRATTWLLAVGALGVVGYCVAGIFVLFGAPDLAMTQFVIETLTVVLFVMAFSRLPDFRRLTSVATRGRDALIAVVAGATITVLLLFAMTVRSSHPISDYYLAHSVSEAHGRNVVNVILVDFRALDTLGEITVLAIAAIGVYSLLSLRPSKQADGEGDAADGAAGSFKESSPETRHDSAAGHASQPEGA
ncbi:putative monovalent cation/H+ antiporter subunit A [Stieleria sp. ICT_E10.1]|uniref:putative monovalent cation/H+ antiporter subunit A n=1 Tax=Stieleria sedimenti TaxID=2976331 RepID=UPI00217F5F93|nr:putative monovalent cation/H+ antiporter subunit A [Stieleria sedimenti]MCS7465853.1 putative monovalent cation/H+ antiporter subunit A [Stieleria sedimenti]